MKCLMPENQRRAIAGACNRRDVLEWGCGGTTLWLLENSNLRTLVTVEHDRDWLQKTIDEADPFWIKTGRWQPRYMPVKVGQNATPGEEQAECWEDAEAYCDECLHVQPQVFIIDGVVRAKCLHHVTFYTKLRWSTVFIHDTQRDWYDDAIAKSVADGFERTDYPEGEDYPGCLLTKLERKAGDCWRTP